MRWVRGDIGYIVMFICLYVYLLISYFYFLSHTLTVHKQYTIKQSKIYIYNTIDLVVQCWGDKDPARARFGQKVVTVSLEAITLLLYYSITLLLYIVELVDG